VDTCITRRRKLGFSDLGRAPSQSDANMLANLLTKNSQPSVSFYARDFEAQI
jgi:hypothetical protein